MGNKNRVIRLVVCFLAAWACLARTPVLQAYEESDFNATPPFVSAGAPPLVMLVLERDDKLYSAAYNDASDLKVGTAADDSTIDILYSPAKFDYYGYFDSHKCYQYISANHQFEPVRVTTDSLKRCNSGGYSGEWSGDWLNYLTMSRMDTLRKVLYGGYRSTDDGSTSTVPGVTVLRRTYIPQDAHTWGKEYQSYAHDQYYIYDYTPLPMPDAGKQHLFANTTLSSNNSTPDLDNPLLRVIQNSSDRIWDWVAKERPEGDDTLAPPSSNYTDSPANQGAFDALVSKYANSFHLLGTDTSLTQINQPSPGNPYNNPWVTTQSDYYINVISGTLSVYRPGNYTFGINGDDAVDVVISDRNNNVVLTLWWYGAHGQQNINLTSSFPSYTGTATLTQGDYHIVFRHQEQAGSDSWNLYWRRPVTDNGSPSGWEVVPAYTTTSYYGLSNLVNKFYDVHTAGGITDYRVQVKVCAPGLLESNCKAYTDTTSGTPVTTYKPTGLLQTYGESNSMYFGLLTGSYTHNLSGGVLRKNISSIKNEINSKTGQIIDPVAPYYPLESAGASNYAAGSIITTINNLRVTGYLYGSGNYYYNTNCGWIENRPINEGECRMWGNPLGEMMYEALNYFSGSKTPTTGFPYDYTKTDTSTNLTSGLADDYSLKLPHPDWINPYNYNDNFNYIYPVPTPPALKPGDPTTHGFWINPDDSDSHGYAYCAKPFMLVLSDINPNFDSDSIPGARNPPSANPLLTPVAEKTIGNTTDPLNAEKLANQISHDEPVATTINYYIGDNVTTHDGICSAKPISGTFGGVTIAGLGDIRGLCPEEPTKQGSFYAAAVAYYGRTHDISSAQDDQNVLTYAVALASALPKISLYVGPNRDNVTLVPFGKSVWRYATCDPPTATSNLTCISPLSTRYQPTCNIADFFVDTLTDTSGIFRVNFEDSEQGADHDQDALVVYKYEILDKDGNLAVSTTNAKGEKINNGVTVRVSLDSQKAAGDVVQHLGYIISGTSQDGTYLVVRDEDTLPGNDHSYYLDVPHTGDLPLTDARQFTPSGVAAAQLLRDPLWYAAKYGGFDEAVPALATPIINHPDPSTAQTKPSYRPLLRSEWDKDNDGVPDTYFYVTNPLRLEVQLKKSFADILKRKASGTAVSVISNSRSGEGAVYQSIFYPWNGDKLGNTVTWAGDVNALFVDVNGNLREDTNGDHKLNIASSTNTSTTDCGDMIVVFDNGTVTKYKDCNGNSVLDASEKAVPFITGLMKDVQINYIWTAGNWLNNLAHPESQRANYTDVGADSTADKRYIFTFIDKDKKMIPASSVPGSSQLPFFSSSLLTTGNVTDATTFYPYLNVYPPFTSYGPPAYIAGQLSNTTVYTDFLLHQTQREIDYIRGVDQDVYPKPPTTANYSIPKFRSRAFDYNNNGYAVTWRLGDIDYSTPTEVGKPSEGYHLLYADYSYAEFLNAYLNRRNVVYAGGNDGMIHAFNAGFYNNATKQFNTQPPTNSSVANFPLGAELWAYVPYNLLPHLFWLTNTDYAHVYYIDQKPRVFDAKIFTADSVHINGWGTVMVVGMRFGGGTVNADLHKSAGHTSPAADDPQMSSAFVVMDITDPENPPRLLAELKLPGLGYTTCYPAVVPMGQILPVGIAASSTTQNDWYLMFGSGPAESDGRAGKASETSLADAGSGQPAKFYVVDLKALAGATPLIKTLDGSSNTFKVFDPSTPSTAYYQVFSGNGFISDPTAVDYQLDYKADAVYFGTVNGDKTNGWTGQMRRIVINNNPTPAYWNGDSVLLDAESVNQPIIAAPTSSTDTAGNRWVFFGTGRLFVKDDKKNTAPQSYYGIKEPLSSPTSSQTNWKTVKRSDLRNVTNVQVSGTDSVLGVVDASTTTSSWSDLVAWFDKTSGWERDFNSSNGERNVGQAALLGSTLIFTTYIPPTDVCDFDGESFLYALYYTTGTAYYRSIIGLNPDSPTMATHISLGKGLAATPNIHIGGEQGSKAFIQTSTGEIKVVDISNATATRSGVRSWRLFEQ